MGTNGTRDAVLKALLFVIKAKEWLISNKPHMTCSCMHAAAEGLRLDVIKLLLSAGAYVNNPSKWIISPLISALIHSELD